MQPSDKAKVVVVMPAYNAAKTLRITYDAIPKDDVDHVILVDDGSRDETLQIAKELRLEVFDTRAITDTEAIKKPAIQKL